MEPKENFSDAILNLQKAYQFWKILAPEDKDLLNYIE
jgi:hypothetical protein